MAGAKVGELRDVPGPKSQKLLKSARKRESQASIYPVFFGSELYAPVIAKTYGPYLEDVDGNQFLDAIGGMACAVQGFRPERIVNAVTRQLQSLSFLPEMLSESRVQLVEELLSVAPGKLKDGKVHFEVSGSSANELALEIAFTYLRSKGRQGQKVLAFHGDFHGRLLATTAIGGIPTYRNRFPSTLDVVLAPFPYPYRCPMGADEDGCEAACLAELERIFESELDPETGECRIGVAVSEPFQSHVTRIPPLNFYRKLRELCDEHDVVFIDDEVVGFTHTGKWFACEHPGVTPDLIPIGKSLSCGFFPISAVLMRKEIAQAWEAQPDMHLTTYMGHPVGATAALENLRSLKEQNLIARGAELGDYFLRKLKALQEKHPLIGFVDGWGFWLEAELVRDRKTKEPAMQEGAMLQRECVKRGLIVDRSLERSALYFIPALTITLEELDKVADILDECLSIVEQASSKERR
jgi:4-aminobutyrate aminotransferase/(S)-3-amino-2-methylpropionate transaminase